MQTVETLLDELGLEETAVLPVFNKRDRAPREAVELARRHEGVPVSAEGGEGLERLVGQIIHRLSQIGSWTRRERIAAAAASGSDAATAPDSAFVGDADRLGAAEDE